MSETIAEVLSNLKTSTEFQVGYRNGYEAAIEKAYEWLKDYTQLRNTHVCKDGEWYNKLEVFKQAMNRI